MLLSFELHPNSMLKSTRNQGYWTVLSSTKYDLGRPRPQYENDQEMWLEQIIFSTR